MKRKVTVYVESKDMKPVKKDAEASLGHPIVEGRIFGLLPEEVALLRPSNEPSICFSEPSTSPFRYHLDLRDSEGNFVAKPCGNWTLKDPLGEEECA